nr:MAG TPA: hypothetical protein [Caudoviricetes sp.]
MTQRSTSATTTPSERFAGAILLPIHSVRTVKDLTYYSSRRLTTSFRSSVAARMTRPTCRRVVQAAPLGQDCSRGRQVAASSDSLPSQKVNNALHTLL